MRDLSEYEIVYLFVDGIADRIRPRRVSAASHTGCATSPPMCPRTSGPRSRPATRRQAGRSPATSPGSWAPTNGRDLPSIRTTNLLERLLLEERRRLTIIPNAFGERPVLKLMFSAMTRAAVSGLWRDGALAGEGGMGRGLRIDVIGLAT